MRDGRESTVDEVMAEIERYHALVTTAGGGVTLTGGEPLLQPAFAGAVLRRCKEAGLHTALDTSGFLGARADDELLADTDLVLLDIKSFDVPTYRALTGGELTPTLDFATRLDRLGVPMWIRYVLVPGWTDTPEPVDGLARFVAGLPAVQRVDVLPFHKLGASKYTALGVPFPLRDTPVPSPELVERVLGQFRRQGVEAY
jgi:pyruvate formate lyase activating enzyme